MKFNKFNLTTSGLFILGFICILFNFLTIWLNLVASVLFVAASVMLTISFYFSCKRKNAILSAENEEVIMELALNDGMERYIPKEKKQGKFKGFIENVRIFTPCIISALLALMMVALLVVMIIKLI